MPRERTARRSIVNRVFQLSGLSTDERCALGKYISKLGGVYIKTDSFKNNATHVVCGKLTRSEKFLGAVALGRWVVKPQYVRDSHAAGKWLDEVDYEWSIFESDREKQLAAAAKRGRWRAFTTTEKIFQEWQVAVILKDVARQNVYRRLLAYGGAKVYDIKLPVKSESSLSSLTYLFTDAESMSLAAQLQQYGILCLNADFISDFLILDPPPDPMDYAFRGNDGTQSTESSQSTSANENVSAQPGSRTKNRAVQMSVDEDDDGMLVLTQATAEDKMKEDKDKCPVILSPIAACHMVKMETPETVARSSHDDKSTVGPHCTVAMSSHQSSGSKSTTVNPKQESAHTILTDVKKEFEELKKEAASGRAALPAFSKQRSLRDWFIPRGKENGCGLLPVKTEPIENQAPSSSRPDRDRTSAGAKRHSQNSRQIDADKSHSSASTVTATNQSEGRKAGEGNKKRKREDDNATTKPAAKRHASSTVPPGQPVCVSQATEIFEVSNDGRGRFEMPDSTADSIIVIDDSSSEDESAPARSKDGGISSTANVVEQAGTSMKTEQVDGCLEIAALPCETFYSFTPRVPSTHMSGGHSGAKGVKSKERKSQDSKSVSQKVTDQTTSRSRKDKDKHVHHHSSVSGSKSTKKQGDRHSGGADSSLERKKSKERETGGRDHTEISHHLPAERGQSGAGRSDTRSSSASSLPRQNLHSESRHVSDRQHTQNHNAAGACAVPAEERPGTAVPSSDEHRTKSVHKERERSTFDGSRITVSTKDLSDAAVLSTDKHKPKSVDKKRERNESNSRRITEEDKSTPKNKSLTGKHHHMSFMRSPSNTKDRERHGRGRARVLTDKMRTFLQNIEAKKRRKSAKSPLTVSVDRSKGLDGQSTTSGAQHTGTNERYKDDEDASASERISITLSSQPDSEHPRDSRSTEPKTTPAVRKDSEAAVTELCANEQNEFSAVVNELPAVDADKSRDQRRPESSRKRALTPHLSSFVRKQRKKEEESCENRARSTGKTKSLVNDTGLEKPQTVRPRGRTVRGISKLLQAERERSNLENSTAQSLATPSVQPSTSNSENRSAYCSSEKDLDLAHVSATNKTKVGDNVVQELSVSENLLSSSESHFSESQSQTQQESDSQGTKSAQVFPIFSQLKAATEAKRAATEAMKVDAQRAKKASRMHPLRRKGPFTEPRWPLSTVPIPGGWVLDAAGATGIRELGSKVIPDSMSMMVGTCLDEGFYEGAVSTAESLNFSCPSAEIIGHLVTVLQEAEEERTVHEAHRILMKWLDLYPPITTPLRKVYEDALQLSDWDFVKQVIEKAVEAAEASKTSEGKKRGEGHRLLLMFVVAVIERNFLHFLHNVSRQAVHTCLVIRCLWHPSFQVYPSARVRQLLQYLETSVKARRSLLPCWENILSLVAMAAQCCQLVGCGWRWDGGAQVDPACSAFIRDVASAISADSSVVVLSVARLPPWLQTELISAALTELEDYLVPGGLTVEPVTLKKIISQYFFLLPRLSEEVLRDSECVSPRKKRRVSCPESQVEEQEPVPVPSKLKADKINKRNPKGESMLHRTAMKNDATLLKQLLAVPGVDVNAKDNAGWTPLHEACNHGSLECVKVLLKFTPGKTIDSFFLPGGQTARRVDMHAANDEGITPLHDAVMNNRMDVAKLLLKYGGSSLLSAKTVSGYTPLDLAGTEGMKQVLLSSSACDSSFSQESSQDPSSQGQARPTSFMYSEVVNNGNVRLAASFTDCARFLTLLTSLLSAQLKLLQQQQKERQQMHQKQQEPQQQNQQLSAVGFAAAALDQPKPNDQQKQQHQQTKEQYSCIGEVQPEHLKAAAENLRRHCRKLTTEMTYKDLDSKLMLVEAVLEEFAQYL